jgi:hypothetical protein
MPQAEAIENLYLIGYRLQGTGYRGKNRGQVNGGQRTGKTALAKIKGDKRLFPVPCNLFPVA